MINVYSKECERLGIIENYSYFKWTRKYSLVGEFELKCTPDNIALIQMGNVITKQGDTEAAVIEYLAYEAVENEMLIVKGRFLTSLLARRIVWYKTVLGGDIGSCIERLVTENAIACAEPDRNIPSLQFKPFNTGITMSKQITGKNLLETISGICSENVVGIRTELVKSTAIMSLYQGRELPVVFSREFENLLLQNYTESCLEYCNLAKVAAEGEGNDRATVIVGAESGLSRREIYVDARDLRSEDYSDVAAYESALAARGSEKLYDMRIRRSFDASANTHSNLLYRKDFDLGDVVTVQSRFLGLNIRLRITEVTETYEQGGLSVDIVFGDPLPTITEKLKGVF